MPSMRSFAVFALCLLPVAAVEAGQADVCQSPVGPVQTLPALSNDTVFTCPQAGTLTIPQLAQAGWKIVQVGPMSDGNLNGYYELIIQK